MYGGFALLAHSLLLLVNARQHRSYTWQSCRAQFIFQVAIGFLSWPSLLLLVLYAKDMLWQLTLLTLRVIRIKCPLVVSVLYKTEWWWELRRWSHKMNAFPNTSVGKLYRKKFWYWDLKASVILLSRVILYKTEPFFFQGFLWVFRVLK